MPVPVNASFDEPTIPLRLQRPLAALWISLGLHGALIALVQVAPPGAAGAGGPVIEARLVSPHAAPSVPRTPDEIPGEAPVLAPSESVEALPAPVAPRIAVTQSTPVPTPAEPELALAPAPPTAPTSSVDLTYYGARDVDVHPRALQEIVPTYPEGASQQQLSGTARLQLKIEADGRVSDIEVVSSNPPDVFDDASIKAFREARFTPAQKNGRPVRALMLIEVTLDREKRRR